MVFGLTQISFHWLSAILLPALFYICLAVPTAPNKVHRNRSVSRLRRFIAFGIDWNVILVGLITPLCLVGLAIEAISTGTWQWSFERAETAKRDLLMAYVFISMPFGIYYFFKWHSAIGRQTPGQRLLGFRFPPFKERMNKPVRNLILWILLGAWLLWPVTVIGRFKDSERGRENTPRRVESI